jgi:pyruvate carboxylase subunit B
VDTCLSPWAYRTSHPAIEPLVATLKYTSRDTGFDLKLLAQCSDYLEKISPTYKHLMDDRTSIIDINVLLHQTPGGMISNLVNQLKEMEAADRLDEVFRQLPIVRKELGQVPLVTPTSQIVGIQTVNNVLFDTGHERYTMITSQVKDLCYGLYGRTASPIDPEVQKKALKDYPRGTEPITTRPADVLDPELDKAKHETDGLAKDMDDVLTYALYPTTGKRFLRWKYGLEEMPAEVKPRTINEVKAQEGQLKKSREGLLVEKPGKPVHEKSPDARTFGIHLNGDSFNVEVEQVGGAPLFTPASPASGRKTTLQLGRQPDKMVLMTPSSRKNAAVFPDKAEPVALQEKALQETPVLTPMPGMVVSYKVREGERVAQGDVVVILEAMKMENFITSPVAGTVRKITFIEGASARKGDVLALIAC